MALTDLLLEDWGSHWRRIVSERDQQGGAFRDPAYWDRRARTFAASTGNRSDGFVDFLSPWLAPHKTLIDAGAGTGRHASPLADQVDWVTAVEPSAGMRELIPPRDNMTVIAAEWELADPAPADLVICCHVVYGVLEIESFVRKLESAGRERVFVLLRFGQMRTPADSLWGLMTGQPRRRQPQFGDFFNLLLGLGIEADVSVLRYPSQQRWASGDEFLAEYSSSLGDAWDETRARGWMAENLERQPDGSLTYGLIETTSGVAHWRPSSQS